MTAIEWTDATWNPVTGCTKVSPGCDHCYAETFAERWRGIPGHHYSQGFDMRLRPERLGLPLRWARPRRVFVNSMSDVFHEAVPGWYVAAMFAVMGAARQHTFQVLTKRHARMRALLSSPGFAADVRARQDALARSGRPALAGRGGWQWPLPNVWAGVSAEDQHRAQLRVPALLATPAAVRFVSAEPLLGPVDLRSLRARDLSLTDALAGELRSPSGEPRGTSPARVSWVIAGGESGPHARPMELAWARSLIAQCQAAGAAIFVKQLGSAAGRELGAGSKGGGWDAWPPDLRIRQFPQDAISAEVP